MKDIFLKSLSSTAIIFMALTSSAYAQGSGAENAQAHDHALAQVKALANLGRNPSDSTVGRLAARFGFSYEQSSCQDTTRFSDYCTYQLSEQHSTVGRVMVLATGWNKRSGEPGGMMLWSLLDKDVCITAEDVRELLGKGKSAGITVPYLPPGGTGSAPAYFNVAYQSIPGAPLDVSAMVFYRDRCIGQILMNF